MEGKQSFQVINQGSALSILLAPTSIKVSVTLTFTIRIHEGYRYNIGDTLVNNQGVTVSRKSTGVKCTDDRIWGQNNDNWCAKVKYKKGTGAVRN